MISRRAQFLLLSVILLSVACATKPQQKREDFGLGFEPLERTQVALVGPVKEDRAAFSRIKELESNGSLGTIDGTRELSNILRSSSQTMLAATAPSLFRAGVYTGSPELIDISCDSMRRVTHAGLRRSNGLGQFEQACDALSGSVAARSNASCGSAPKLLSAYQALKLGDEKKARQEAAAGLREQGLCSNNRPLVRTPVAPESRGFMIVVALQALNMPPATFLGNEPAPRTSDAINAAFAQNARMIKNGES